MQKDVIFPTEEEVDYLTDQRMLKCPKLSRSEAQKEVLGELHRISNKSLLHISHRA